MVFNKKNNDNYRKVGELSNGSPEELFKVGNDIKSEYSMFGLIFSEIAVLRMECSRLGTMVRINNSNSPNYLEGYHAHIYSLLLPCSTVTADKNHIWNKKRMCQI